MLHCGIVALSGSDLVLYLLLNYWTDFVQTLWGDSWRCRDGFKHAAGHAEGVARRGEVSARGSGHSRVSVTWTR